MLNDKINAKDVEIQGLASHKSDLEWDLAWHKRECTDLWEENRNLIIDVKAMNLFESSRCRELITMIADEVGQRHILSQL